MLRFSPLLRAIPVLACLAFSLAGRTAETLIPLEHFFAESDMRSVQLSPDGKRLAFLATLGTGKVGIALMDLATGKIEPLVAAKDENIKTYFWKGNDYVVYGGDLGGNESPAWRSFNIPKRKVMALAESFRERYADLANQGILIDELRFDPNHILVFGNKDIGSTTFQFWTVDIRNAERRPANSGDDKPDTTGLLVDTKGVARARSRYEGDKMVYEVRATATSRFSKIREFPLLDPKWQLVQMAADDETIYLISTEHNPTGTLYSYDLRTKQLGAPLFETTGTEIDGDSSPFASYGDTVGVLFSYDRSKLYGVTTSPDRTHFHFLNPEREKLQATIDASLPNTFNLVVSTSQDEKVMLVLATSDRDPGTYYILDLRNPRLMAIGKNNRYIDPAKTRPMEPIQFTARDGQVLHGYLTRPAGAEGKRVPLIINPHGGPFGPRDFWHYNTEVQFLASRGYAVLQINYRGSGGYGPEFESAGYREWGGKMQDDLTDGVKWAIAQGITDARHVAIYGASYGGYAALAGVTFTPELYRCAVNYVGVSDLGLIAGWGDYKRSNRGYNIHAKERVGDDPKYIHDRSPVNFVDRIRVPTLHAYGFNDPRVDIKNWSRLEAKLKQYGKPYDILIMGDEGHGFYNESNRLAFYRKLEAFLAKNMTDVPDGRVDVKEGKVIEMPVKGSN